MFPHRMKLTIAAASSSGVFHARHLEIQNRMLVLEKRSMCFPARRLDSLHMTRSINRELETGEPIDAADTTRLCWHTSLSTLIIAEIPPRGRAVEAIPSTGGLFCSSALSKSCYWWDFTDWISFPLFPLKIFSILQHKYSIIRFFLKWYNYLPFDYCWKEI